MKSPAIIRITLLLCLFQTACDNSNATKGCTNTNACNYNSSAEEDDGSCYEICLNDSEKARVVEFVNKAVSYLSENTLDDSIVAFSAPNPMPAFIDEELYIFLLDISLAENNLVPMLAHGTNESIIGENQYDVVDAQGKYFVQEFLALLENTNNTWTWYYWEDPRDQVEKKKFSFIVQTGDLLIGAGTYLN